MLSIPLGRPGLIGNVVPFSSGIRMVKHPACNKYHIRALCPFLVFFWRKSFEARKERLAARELKLGHFHMNVRLRMCKYCYSNKNKFMQRVHRRNES